MIRLRVVEGGRRSPKNKRAGKGEINRVTISEDNGLAWESKDEEAIL